eukprot:549191-Lingulodinium_polyedra.AAC.1
MLSQTQKRDDLHEVLRPPNSNGHRTANMTKLTSAEDDRRVRSERSEVLEQSPACDSNNEIADGCEAPPNAELIVNIGN